MPDSSPMAGLVADKDFLALSPADQVIATSRVLGAKDSDFAKLDPAEQSTAAAKILEARGIRRPAVSPPSGPTELRKPLPGPVQFAEDYVAPVIGQGVGALAGGATGALTGNPVGVVVGGMAGAGAGLAAQDYLAAQVNKRFFGRDPDLSMANVLPNEAINVGIGAATQAIPVGSILSKAVGTAPLAAGAKIAAEEATAASEKFAGTPAAQELASRTAGQVTSAGQEAVKATTEELAPQARAAAVESALGRTAAQGVESRAVAAPGGLPSQAAIGRQQGFYDTVFGPLHRASDALGQRYATLFGAVKESPVNDLKPLGDAVANSQQFATDSGYTYTKSVRDILDKTSTMAAAERFNPADFGYSPKKWANLSPDGQEAVRKMAARLTPSGGVAQTAPEGPTVQELLTQRSEAGAITRSNAPSRDKAAAFGIISGIDDTLEGSGLVDSSKLNAINRQYRSYKQTFDQGFRRKIASSIEPTDVAGEIFQQPQRFQQIVGGATPDELSKLRRTYADWINSNPKVMGQPDQGPVLQKLFPNTALSDPKNWINLDDKAATAVDVMATSPEMRLKFTTALHDRIGQIVDDASQKAVDYGLKTGPTLGTDGIAMAKAVKAAPNARAGAQIVVDFFKSHPDQAPVRALMEGQTPPPGNFMRRAVRGLSWYPEILAGTALMGHPSYFAAAAMGSAGIAGTHMLLQKGVKFALRNPETAQAMWMAISNPNSFGATRTLGKLTADALRAEVAEQAAQLYGSALSTQEDQPTK